MFVILRRSTLKNLRVQRPFAALRVTGYKDTQGDIKNCPVFHALRNNLIGPRQKSSLGIPAFMSLATQHPSPAIVRQSTGGPATPSPVNGRSRGVALTCRAGGVS